jgi:Protein of unknown function (DUF732)
MDLNGPTPPRRLLWTPNEPRVGTRGCCVCAGRTPGHADGNQYLADLAAHGVPMVSQANALDQGLTVCGALRSGVAPEQTFGNFGFFTGFAATIVDLAQHDLCPDTRH